MAGFLRRLPRTGQEKGERGPGGLRATALTLLSYLKREMQDARVHTKRGGHPKTKSHGWKQKGRNRRGHQETKTPTPHKEEKHHHNTFTTGWEEHLEASIEQLCGQTREEHVKGGEQSEK